MRFPTTPADHLALQEEMERERAVGAEGEILSWMSAHGARWLDTWQVLRENDYPDFEAEPPANRAAVRIQDRLEVVSPGEPYEWLSATYAELGRERPLDLLRRGRAAEVLILLDELALTAPDDYRAREHEAMLRAFRWAESTIADRRASD